MHSSWARIPSGARAVPKVQSRWDITQTWRLPAAALGQASSRNTAAGQRLCVLGTAHRVSGLGFYFSGQYFTFLWHTEHVAAEQLHPQSPQKNWSQSIVMGTNTAGNHVSLHPKTYDTSLSRTLGTAKALRSLCLAPANKDL